MSDTNITKEISDVDTRKTLLETIASIERYTLNVKAGSLTQAENLVTVKSGNYDKTDLRKLISGINQQLATVKSRVEKNRKLYCELLVSSSAATDPNVYFMMNIASDSTRHPDLEDLLKGALVSQQGELYSISNVFTQILGVLNGDYLEQIQEAF